MIGSSFQEDFPELPANSSLVDGSSGCWSCNDMVDERIRRRSPADDLLPLQIAGKTVQLLFPVETVWNLKTRINSTGKNS